MAKTYLSSIDSLRALAVIAVLVFHMHAGWLPGGFSGVDVFFVISGYVISRSMTELDRRRLSRFVLAFYARRLRRILPALLVCLLVTTMAAVLFIPDAWLSDKNFSTARYAFWGFGNLLLLKSGDTYFAPRIEFNPYAHTWSLGVEEQFYLLYPLVFFFWLERSRFPLVVRRLLQSLLPVLFMASLTYSSTVSQEYSGYYSLRSRFWELAAGGLLWQRHMTSNVMTTCRVCLVVQWLLSFLMIGVGFVFAKTDAFPVPWALAPVMGTLGLIDAISRSSQASSGRVLRWLEWPVSVAVGRMSYSLYLWHWPVYVMFRWTIGFDSWGHRVSALVLVLLVAYCSYRWVENPARRNTRLIAMRPSLAVMGSLACIVLAAATAARMHAWRHDLSLSQTRDTSMWYPDEWQDVRTSRGGQPCRLQKTTTQLEGQTTLTEYQATKCSWDGYPRQPPSNVFVTGNSHALAYTTMLTRLAVSEAYVVHVYSRAGCTMFELTRPMAASVDSCGSFYAAVQRDIKAKAAPGDVLFLPALRLARLSDQWMGFTEAESLQAMRSKSAREQRRTAVLEAVNQLQGFARQGLAIVIEAPKPIFRAPAFRCSDWFNRGNAICRPGLSVPRDYLLNYRKPMLNAISRLAAADRAVYVWDPFDTLCPASDCAAIANGKPLFFDGDHLSGYGNELLYPEFVKMLRTVRGRLSTSAPDPLSQ